jgi:hypothetical protein
VTKESQKARKPEKLTKTERRLKIAEAAKKLLQKAIAAGYQLWKPGEIVQMSDRSYLVRKDGSWKRLDPGMVILIGRREYLVGARGELTFVRARSAA